MTDNFQQTVNLRGKIKKREGAKKAEEIDKIYEGEEKSLDKIDKPEVFKFNEGWTKKILAIIFLVMIVLIFYFVLGDKKGGDEQVVNENNWYAVKLITGEVYYGQIGDTSTDPVIIENVYYDYDQLNSDEETSEPKNLRLVKRGKETLGGDGSMNVVRIQVVVMEPLRDDSKVLQAILNYEK